MHFSSFVQVHVKRSFMDGEDIISSENGDISHLAKPLKPLVRKSKLVVVDLAGSERIHKSGVCPTHDLSHSYSTWLFVFIIIGYWATQFGVAFHPWTQLGSCAFTCL